MSEKLIRALDNLGTAAAILAAVSEAGKKVMKLLDKWRK